MSRILGIGFTFLLALVLAAATPAWSQTQGDEGWFTEEEESEVILEEPGLEAEGDVEVDEAVIPRPQPEPVQTNNFAVELGGGVNSFTGDIDDELDVGGNWELRGIWGMNSPVGVEVSYFGAANSLADVTIGNVALGQDGELISSAGEALLRLNLMEVIGQGDIQIDPFLAAGVNYYRFDGSGGADVSSDANETIGVPLAAGVTWMPTNNFSLGARGGYRILTTALDDNFPDGNQWNVGLTVGAVF